MKKFLYEYKSYKVRSEMETAKEKSKRERITLTSRRTISPTREYASETNVGANTSTNVDAVGTIRTDEYKRDLAEFQARRSSGHQEDTPTKNCGSVCTDCATDPDKTFNYEKKSATKYKKKRERSTSEEIPNIQFLFQNQVFMPGNMYAQATYSEPYKPRKKKTERRYSQKHIEFKEDSPPLFYKNNSLPFDVKNFVSSPSEEEVDGPRVSSSSSKDDSSAERLLEMMSELRSFDQWVDEQLKPQSNSSRLDDCRSDTSTYGLPVVSSSDVDVTVDKARVWSQGRWGVIPVQVKKLKGVTVERARGHREINILRKCRHPNIILLMGIYPDIHDDVHLICERCVDTLYNILHVQGRILSAQTSIAYASDIAHALVFLQMRGYVYTALTSHDVVVTSRDAAKLANVACCLPLEKERARAKGKKDPASLYENIGEAQGSLAQDLEPLLSARSSEELPDCVLDDVTAYSASPHYRWHAPELFAEDSGVVRACGRTTVYSLALLLWECCNAMVPWRSQTYSQLKEQYLLWGTGLPLQADGAYPGALLAALRAGLGVARAARPALPHYTDMLTKLKQTVDQMEYIVIPARLSKRSNFSSVWDSPADRASPRSPRSPRSAHSPDPHAGVNRESSSESDKESNAIYETLEKPTYAVVEKCYSEDETDRRPMYEKLRATRDNDFSSACSTPISKIRARVKDLGTPITLHRSDSTEYCSIRSPDSRLNFDGNNNSTTSTKFSKSFTPQSYKPLHIKVPEFNLDSFKELPKNNSGGKPSYNFDIKNYSLPNTPIARSNKLRKNAWLSGDLVAERDKETDDVQTHGDFKQVQSAPDTPAASTYSSIDKDNDVSSTKTFDEERSPESIETRDHFVTFRTSHQDSSPSCDSRERTHSWSFKTTERSPKKPDEDLAHVNVKPLVAIHEKWIYEANKKTSRSMSLPEENCVRSAAAAVKPASHVVDPWQKSLPQLNIQRAKYKPPAPPCKTGALSGQYCAARDSIARCLALSHHDRPWRHTSKCITPSPDIPPPFPPPVQKVDQTTDTNSIEDFIRDIIKTEIQTLLHTGTDQKITKSDDLVSKGVSNVMDALKNPGDNNKMKFSRVKINGNNKPLMQITFARNGENYIQVMDNCVNVTFCDKPENRDKLNVSLDGREKLNVSLDGRDKFNVSLDEPVTPDDGNPHSLKRCQTFNALQEARSTEDLYIDDDLSTHMQENFGGRVALIPLHGSLHEILCEREDECCLIKVKQENGCDAVYFRCENSDTESRDAADGCGGGCGGGGARGAGRGGRGAGRDDTLVYKRSFSLVEERFERVKTTSPLARKVEPRRPKSEVFLQKFNREMRVLSNSSPSLSTIKDGEVEVNIENVIAYQDSSSDECLRCQADDDFETLEREIEKEVADSNLSKGLGKISEENLSIINEESSEKETGSDDDGK